MMNVTNDKNQTTQMTKWQMDNQWSNQNQWCEIKTNVNGNHSKRRKHCKTNQSESTTISMEIN